MPAGTSVAQLPSTNDTTNHGPSMHHKNIKQDHPETAGCEACVGVIRQAMMIFFVGVLALGSGLTATIGCGGGSSGSAGDRAMQSMRSSSASACTGGDAAACDRVCSALGPPSACETACTAGHPTSCLELGLDATHGLPRPGDGTRIGAWSAPDPTRATALLAKGCALGSASACIAAAEPLLVVTSIDTGPANEMEAVRLLSAGCNLEHDHASAVDARWLACLQLVIYHAQTSNEPQRRTTSARACELSPTVCKTVPNVGAWNDRLAAPAGASELIANDHEAAVVRGKNESFMLLLGGDQTDLHAMIGVVSWDHAYLGRALPRLLEPESPVLQAVLLQYDRIMRASRIASVPAAELSREVNAYTRARLDLHSHLAARYGVETLPATR